MPLTRVDFSLPKIQNRPRILNFFFLEQAPVFKVLLQNKIPFLTIWSQTSKSCFPEKRSQFSSQKLRLSFCSTECLPVTIIIGKLYSNKLILPVGALVSCFRQQKQSINKRTEYFHFCSVILEQRVPRFL